MINIQRLAQSNILRSSALQIQQHFMISNPNHQLKQIIQNTKSVNQFLKIFSQYKQQFKAETYANSSKTICKILQKHHEPLQFNLIKQIIDKMNLIDLSQINDYQIISIISILRNLNMKNISTHAYKQLLNTLADKYIELIKEKNMQVTQLTNLLNAFHELFYFKYMSSCKIVTQKIEKLLLQNQKITITNNQKSFIFFCLSQKSSLSREEKNIRRFTLKKVYEEFPRINLTELVKIAQNLPKIDTIDMDFQEIGSMNLVLSKIFQNIPELDESSIFDIIRTDFTNKHQGFVRIYKQILKNVFQEIDEKGQCKLNHDSVLKIFQSLANKVQFFRLSEQDLNKYISFIQKYIAIAKNNNKQEYLISKLQNLIIHETFPNFQARNRLMKALIDNQIPIRARMLFHLSVKGYNVDSFFDQIKNIDTNESKSIFLVKIIIILNRIKQNVPQAVEVFDKIYHQLEKSMSTPEKFVQLYLQLTNSYNKQQLRLFNFNYIFQKAFQSLPNPFQLENSDRKYKQLYLQYMLTSYNLKDFISFTNSYLNKLSDEQFNSVIFKYNYKDHRYVKPFINYSYLVNAKLLKATSEEKSKKVYSAIIQYLSTQIRFVVYKQLNNYQETLVFNSLNYLINHIQIVQELQLIHQFTFTLEKYLISSFRNYKYQHNYRNLLYHVLKNISKFATKERFVAIALREGLQLNILNKNHVENIQLEKLRLNYFQKSRINYLKDNSYTTKIQKVHRNSLKVILSNPNLQDYMVQHEGQIIQIIKKSYNFDLINYLVIFKHKINSKTFKILEVICQTIISKINRFQRLDLVGIAHSITSLSSNSLSQVKKLVAKISETMKFNISSVSLENHIQMIKLFTTMPGLNMTQYYNYLAEYVQKSNRSDGVTQNFYYRLSATNYQFKDSQLKVIHKIIAKNVFQGIYFFLMNQLKYDQQTRVEIVQKLVNQLLKFVTKLQNNNNSNVFVYKFFYDYIKAKYPQQTKQLNLTAEKLEKYKFSFKPRKEFLPLMTQLTGLEPQFITQFEDNFIVKFQNHYFIFLYDKKLGAFNEHYFLKRAVPLALNLPETTNVVCIGSIVFPNTINYINKQCQGLFIEAKLTEYLEQSKKKRQKKTQSRQEI